MLDEMLSRYWPQLAAAVLVAMAWGDLRRSQRSHQETTKEGFKGVNTRLDRVNGRLDKHADKLQEHGERLSRGDL